MGPNGGRSPDFSLSCTLKAALVPTTSASVGSRRRAGGAAGPGLRWQMRRALAPLLFEDDGREAARAARPSPVAVARVSERAKRKAD